MRAAFEHEVPGAAIAQQRRQQGLHDEQRATGRADREVVAAGRQGAGAEAQPVRAELGTFHLGIADHPCRRDAGQVLAPQAGPLSAGADALDAKRRARGQGEREGGADDLPAALAVRAVDGQHGPVPARPSFPAARLAV